MIAVIPAVATVVVFAMSLNVLGSFFRPVQFYSRFLLCFLSMSVCASYGLVATIVLSLIGRRSLSQWAAGRAFSTLTCPLIGLKFDVVNEHRLETRPAVYVGNHQSDLDLVLLGRVFPKHCSVTAKKSLKYVPFLGWFMMISGTVFIDRQNRNKAIRALDETVNKMREDQQSVFLFPEGTRSNFSTPDMLPFKRGAFHLAIQSGFPIVPIVAENYSHVFSLKDRILCGGVVRVEVLEPIPTAGLEPGDVDDLILRVRSAMLSKLKEISTHCEADEDTASSLLASEPAPDSTPDLVEEGAAVPPELDETEQLARKASHASKASEVLGQEREDSFESDTSKLIEMENASHYDAL
ncbi:uncharacterized protein V1510DRAFT_419046 [Dipodascopsis tothii]|uniref:uncharacterized protein n=1 Tax=Dipodascopsis tothii TaxID=44089 RepID=UPI0034CD47B1